MRTRRIAFVLAATLTGCTAPPGAGELSQAERGRGGTSLTAEMPSPSGRFQTFTASGSIDTGNPFFQSLGTNGRSCGTCHVAGDGWTITPADVQARFEATQGTDPIFRTNDGSNSPNADVSTEEARRSAYSMLLTKGLIRVGIGIPAGADFTLAEVDDPYHYASAAELSLFRRPLPSTNLGFLATVMWDGRETLSPTDIPFDLADQANGATLGHAQASRPLDSATKTSIVNFELALFTAATFDNDAGNLTARHGNGGPAILSQVAFHIGINDALSPGFNPDVFQLYTAWAGAPGGGTDGARAAVARGEALFNELPIAITGVAGLNDKLGQPTINGHCSTCHDTPSVGDHSVGLPIDIGIAAPERRTPDLPLYTLCSTATPTRCVQTTDPGRALITGKFADIGKFKGPILRDLAPRAPYFHNGSAATLDDVVSFYDERFNLGLSPQPQGDRVAFLKTL